MTPTNKFVTLCSKISPGLLPVYCKLLLLSMKFWTLAVTWTQSDNEAICCDLGNNEVIFWQALWCTIITSLMMMYHQTKFGSSVIINSEDIMKKVIFWCCAPCDLDLQYSTPTDHHTKFGYKKFGSSEDIQTYIFFFFFLMNVCCDFDPEHSNQLFSLAIWVYGDLSSNKVWLQKNDLSRRYKRNSNILIVFISPLCDLNLGDSNQTLFQGTPAYEYVITIPSLVTKVKMSSTWATEITAFTVTLTRGI